MNPAAAGEIARFFVPGRIEVLGKHTDYAGGRSLLCAAERGFCVVCSPRNDAIVRVADAVRDLRLEMPFSGDTRATSGWETYVGTVIRRLARNFPGSLRGADIAFASDLPRSAGMSSSSALMIAIFAALNHANKSEEREEYRRNIRTKEDVATYLACIENGQSFGTLAGDAGVGTFGGSEDHIAILCCKPETISQYAFAPARLERGIVLPPEYVFAIGVSGIAADKTGNAKDAYNRASLAAAAILALWRRVSGRADDTLFTAINSSADAVVRIRHAIKQSALADFPSHVLLDRFEQFVVETRDIIPDAADALDAGDFENFGALASESQAAAVILLRNQIPETIQLARSAGQLGAIAASAFGAGFGGSVWALIKRNLADSFLERWAAAYRAKFPGAESEFFITRPGPAMLKVTSG
jgi:galactokinase